MSKREDTNHYVVYPKISADKDQTTSIGKLLESVVSDPRDVVVHASDLGVAFLVSSFDF